MPVIIADATLPQTLEAASLPNAAAVAVVTSDDLANLETGLAVRDQLGDRWRDVPVVLRMFDSPFARSVRHNFGFSSVRSTAALAAPWFVGAALGLDVLSTFYADDEPLLVARLAVSAPDGGLNGLAMSELSARTRVLAIRRAADEQLLEHPPRRGTRFRVRRPGLPHRPVRGTAGRPAPATALPRTRAGCPGASGPARRPPGSTSSARTTICSSNGPPKVVAMATSEASRPRPIRIRPLRRMLFRGSKVHQRSPSQTSIQAAKSIGAGSGGTSMSGR